jgi:hypothetical protein
MSGDINLYFYLRNNPLNLKDPEGLAVPVALGLCFLDPACVAALGVAATATGMAAGKLIESISKQQRPPADVCPPSDPGDFLRFCIGACRSRFPDSFFKRQMCYLGCIMSAL